MILTNKEEIMRIAKVMEICRLEGKVKFIFVIKELMDCGTNKARAILVCFNGKSQALGAKTVATSKMEKSIEISLKDISAATRKKEYRDKLAVIPYGQINRNPGGHSSGILNVTSNYKGTNNTSGIKAIVGTVTVYTIQ